MKIHHTWTSINYLGILIIWTHWIFWKIQIFWASHLFFCGMFGVFVILLYLCRKKLLFTDFH